MNNQNAGTGSLVMGVIGVVLSVVGFFVFGWLNIISAILGIIACCLPAPSLGYKTTGIIALILGTVGSILWFALVGGMI